MESTGMKMYGSSEMLSWVGCFADMIGVETWFAISGIFITDIAVVGAVLPSIKELYGGVKKDK